MAADAGGETRGRGLLAGRRAVVTGAANGIGTATAERFAAEGAKVVLLDHEADALRAAQERVAGSSSVVCDVRDDAAVASAMAAAADRLGGLDVVVANAAVEPQDDDRVDRLAVDVWRRVIDTNLTGAFLTAKFGLQHLLGSDAADRTIVFTVSPTGVRGCAPGENAYSASKAGVQGLMRVLAHDCAADGIRVNAVMPGFTDTRANAAVLADPDLYAAALATIPLRRIGSPAEVAAMMAWVASTEARYATGAVFTVDGGQTAV